MTPERFKAIRHQLGLSQRGTARFLRMGKHGFRNVQRWEKGEQDVPHWAELIFEIMTEGVPDLEPYRQRSRTAL